MQITYLSHGQKETGGYRHETEFAEALSDAINHCAICYKKVRFNKNYQGFFAWMVLFLKTFFNARGEVIITVARLAWPVYLRNIFNRNKIILVLHNFDKKDGKRSFYFSLLERYFKKVRKHPQRLLVITVAEYWKNNLSENYGISPVLFPNFFETQPYFFYRDIVKKNPKLIHFGQWSDKADKKKYHLLWHELKRKGYQCYFSTDEEKVVADLPVEFFKTREAYLKKMALSYCTIILNKVNEGWNRVANESLLTGTQVMTNDNTGPAELMKLGNGYLVSNINEILQLIEINNLQKINFENLQMRDNKNMHEFLEPVLNWIKA